MKTVAFESNADILRTLEAAAAEQGRSLEEYIENSFVEYLNNQEGLRYEPSVQGRAHSRDRRSDRRSFIRKATNLRAVMKVAHSKKIYDTRGIAVLDLSLGGLGAQVRGDDLLLERIRNGTADIVLSLPQSRTPLLFKGITTHYQSFREGFRFGLSFISGAIGDFQQLAIFLKMNSCTSP